MLGFFNLRIMPNNLGSAKHYELKNGTKEFREQAKLAEKIMPIRYTSGMGSENYFSVNGSAFDHYEDAVKEVMRTQTPEFQDFLERYKKMFK